MRFRPLADRLNPAFRSVSTSWPTGPPLRSMRAWRRMERDWILTRCVRRPYTTMIVTQKRASPGGLLRRTPVPRLSSVARGISRHQSELVSFSNVKARLEGRGTKVGTSFQMPNVQDSKPNLHVFLRQPPGHLGLAPNACWLFRKTGLLRIERHLEWANRVNWPERRLGPSMATSARAASLLRQRVTPRNRRVLMAVLIPYATAYWEGQ